MISGCASTARTIAASPPRASGKRTERIAVARRAEHALTPSLSRGERGKYEPIPRGVSRGLLETVEEARGAIGAVIGPGSQDRQRPLRRVERDGGAAHVGQPRQRFNL